jgi:hypothetical protein
MSGTPHFKSILEKNKYSLFMNVHVLAFCDTQTTFLVIVIS